MSRRRWRWTRARYYRAQHLSRLGLRVGIYSAPPLVEAYHLLMATPGCNGRDPLEALDRRIGLFPA